MAVRVRRAITGLAGLCWVLTAPLAAAPPAESEQSQLNAALESLIAGRSSPHNDHDDGEWLQIAVTDAITSGDRAIERLAIRAAYPVRARIGNPISAASSPTSIEIDTRKVLNVPRPVLYKAKVLASFDGNDFVPLGELDSGKSQWFSIRDVGAAARLPGYHSVEVQVVLAFRGNARTNVGSWRETRNLPRLFYAVHEDETVVGRSSGVRELLEAAAAVPVSGFDPLLAGEPFGAWLKAVLAAGARKDEEVFTRWGSHFCSDRTDESETAPDPTVICAVVDFQVGTHIGAVWFKTATVRITETGATWQRVSPPRFEGYVIRGSMFESRRLSNLPGHLDHPELRPVADIAVNPDDIVLSPAQPRPGVPASVKVTVRNNGSADAFKVAVHVIVASGKGYEQAASRMFVVDVPAESVAAVTLQAVLPDGYGIVSATAFQATQHSPSLDVQSDPTPEDACAFRIVNPALAPAGFVESLGASHCRGK